MADVVNLTKRLIGKEDISFDTGGTYASEDFITPSGEHKNLSKINASHIPLVLDTREKFNNANNVDDALKEVGKRIDGFKALDTLVEDIEISFDNDATVNYMQSVINEQKKNLNGHTITFLFPVSLTQNMYSTLEWEDFFNGTIIIHGGTADNRIDLISRLNVMKSIFSIKRCQCEFKIRFFNFQHQNITYAIEAESTTSVIIENCIFYGMADEYSAAVHNINSNIDFTDCDFSDDEKTDPHLIKEHNAAEDAHKGVLLPLSGGEMTGPIYANKSGGIRAKHAEELMFIAGTDWQGNARIVIRGQDSSYNPGGVEISASKGGEQSQFVLTPSGSCKFNGKDVELVDSIGDNFIRYSNGIQICWGYVSIGGYSTKSVTFPKAFATTPCIHLTGNGFGVDLIRFGNQSGTSFNMVTSSFDGSTICYSAIGKWK